jgi:hypothetical protein
MCGERPWFQQTPVVAMKKHLPAAVNRPRKGPSPMAIDSAARKRGLVRALGLLALARDFFSQSGDRYMDGLA